MKAIMINDHPRWCALMMNGKKNVEVRAGTALYKATQKLIDEYGFAEFFVYCAKEHKNARWCNRDTLRRDRHGKKLTNHFQLWTEDCVKKNEKLNGKVIFKFRCYKVEEIPTRRFSVCTYPYTETLDDYELLDKSCLSTDELENYLGNKNGCAIHISDLEIFDGPKELSEFEKHCKKCNFPTCIRRCRSEYCHDGGIPLTKAPKNWCYVDEVL